MHLSYFLDTTIVTLLFSVRYFKMYAKTIVLQKQGIPNCYVAYFGDLHSRVTIMISNSFSVITLYSLNQLLLSSHTNAAHCNGNET